MAHPSVSIRPFGLAWLEQAGERRYVESETRIGRGDHNNVRLVDASVSRDHALIQRVDGVYVISDLDSANGTFVNEQRVYAPRPLSGGDRIRLAETEFTFELEPAEVPDEARTQQPVATSISQFLTISGRIDLQNYLEGDLRVVTILFLDLCGFTALSERMSPEQVTLVVNQCFQHLTQTAIRFGGFVDKYIGDAMMVLFGAPKAHDDDAERAVRAAVAMQEELVGFSARLKQRSGIEINVRMGINTGEVLAGAVGSGQFSAFTVMGDTVNLASRLEEQARVGHVLVNETTYQLTKHCVRYSGMPPIQIRGKNEPVTAYEVEGLVPEKDTAIGASQFVGRDTEIGVIETLLSATGPLRSVVVSGPPGSGKSRLLKEVRDRHVRTSEWITISCAELFVRETATLGSLAEDIRELARRAPVVVVIDRVDLAQPAQLGVLEGLAEQLVDANVLLVITARGAPEGHWPAKQAVLELRELTHDEASQLVGAMLESNDIEPAARDTLVRLGGGSPLVLEEFVIAARSSGALALVDSQWRLLGDVDIRHAFRLRMMVQERLDRLTPEQHDLLRLVSVVGGPYSERLMSSSDAPESTGDQPLSQLLEMGILSQIAGEAGALYFIPDEGTRAVVAASLPQIERRRLHERIALALQRQYDPRRPDPIGLKRIAQHFASAGQHWRAVEYLLRSADLAAATAPPASAVEHYRQALEEAQLVTDRKERARLALELQERIGDALLKHGSLAEAQIAYELAASNAALERQAELYLKLAVTGVRRGNPRRVLDVTRVVLDQPGVTEASRASAEALAAFCLSSQGAIGLALERVARCLELLAHRADPSTFILAHNAAGRAHLLAGHLEEARRELRLSTAVPDLAPEHTLLGESHLLLGLVQCELGELDEAERSVRQGIGPAATSDRWTRTNAGLVLARLFAYRGKTARAARHAKDALVAAEAAAARELGFELRLELARLGAVPPEDVQAVVDAALARGLEPVACRGRIELALLLIDTEPRKALKLAREATLQARSLGLTLHEAVARRVLAQTLAQVGEWSHAAREFESAASIQQRMRANIELVRTLVAGCEAEYAHAAAPRLDKLRGDLARATQTAKAIGLQHELGEATRMLVALQ